MTEESFRQAAGQGDLEALQSIVNDTSTRQDIVALDFFNSKDKDDCTALWYSAQNGHTEVVLFLVNQCGVDMHLANVSTQHSSQITFFYLLLFIVVIFSVLFFSFLVQLSSQSPVYIASEKGHHKVIEALAAHGANLNQCNVSTFVSSHI